MFKNKRKSTHKRRNRKRNNFINKNNIKKIVLFGILIFLFLGGFFTIWATTLNLPDLDSFEERKVSQSTKIYDRSGEIILYDVFKEHKRTVISLNEMSDYIQKATIAVEDQNFYKHGGIEVSAIFRAAINNLKKGDLFGGQGGSTITQQVIKNALLTRDKKISRKLQEWVLAPRLEKVLSKDQILEIYLNEVPYGGSVYGIQEAARRFFSKNASDLNLAESAYLAAMPQAPTFYSPYGNNFSALERRKNHVLDQMYNSGFISDFERDEAKNIKIEFEKQEEFGIKAPHFVLYIREQLEQEYGREILEQGGLKVITTLDWELQEAAEEIVKRKALENKQRFDAENAALVATNPQTGEILVMVGSRDYFDKEIDGNFNIATANRQPGSTFKPIVYAEAFNKGYWPETVVFDLSTEFSTSCSSGGNCYRPVNYDGNFRGPISFRDALAQSVNIPAVKALYLAGLRDSLLLARNMGLGTLGDHNQYGLTLVLGGGEVRPIDISQAYGVFAADGVKAELQGIMKIEDNSGEIIFESKKSSERIMSEQTARLINDVLSDNVARTPAFGSNSPLNFPGRDVATKTGTTNDYRDAWTIGYTPNIVVTAWAGNNDNRSMDKQVAGFIITPLWNEFMQIVLEKIDHDNFISPESIDLNIKPVLAGFWKGEETEVFDSSTGEKASENTIKEDRVIVVKEGLAQINSILHWVDRRNPTGPIPQNPSSDPQYRLWERPVSDWVFNQGIPNTIIGSNLNNVLRTRLDIISLKDNQKYLVDEVMRIIPKLNNREIISGEVYINNEKIGNLGSQNNEMSFFPNEIEQFRSGDNNIRVLVVGDDNEVYEKELTIFSN